MKRSFTKIKEYASIILIGVFTFLGFNAKAQFKLFSTGSISIGSITQPPAWVELQVIGNSLHSNNTGVITSSAFIRGLNVFSTDTNPDFSWWGDIHTGIFHPIVNSIAFAILGNEAMRLSPSGNLLVGTTVDNGDKLQVYGASNANSFDVFSTASTNNLYSGINWLNNTTTKAWAVEYGGQDQFYVNGSGAAYAYSWNSLSDSTLKENIHGIQSALNKVLQLQGVTYNFKSSSKGFNKESGLPENRQMGLLAQAVERVVPEVVSTTGSGLKTIAYSNLVGLLIEAMKQEDARVTILQHKLDSCIVLNKHNSLYSGNVNGEQAQAKLYQCSVGSEDQNCSIQCYVPEQSNDAKIMLFDMNGTLKRSIPISNTGKQYINISANTISAGMYYYTLVINGKEIDTKKLIIAKQ
ncbi:MAG TPA: tail fiber domain-containing protein [Bacteroidia bacterium]|jgi:hypothetical protein|nr:tail fiber domain-containing protein [Bacteroidia bacterium]